MAYIQDVASPRSQTERSHSDASGPDAPMSSGQEPTGARFGEDEIGGQERGTHRADREDEGAQAGPEVRRARPGHKAADTRAPHVQAQGIREENAQIVEVDGAQIVAEPEP